MREEKSQRGTELGEGFQNRGESTQELRRLQGLGGGEADDDR